MEIHRNWVFENQEPFRSIRDAAEFLRSLVEDEEPIDDFSDRRIKWRRGQMEE